MPGPPASSPEARKRMQANRGRDTAPELALRRELHHRGLRFRVDHPPLPHGRRRADIVFPRAKVAVFVDGCWWHGCPVHGTQAKANVEFWTKKIAANQRRDAETDELLRNMGWTSVRVWEHELVLEAANGVERIVRAAQAPTTPLEGQRCDHQEVSATNSQA